MKRRSFLRAAALSGIGSLSLLGVRNAIAAQTYPSRSVRIVVPFSAGGSADKLARTLAQKLTPLWGHTVIVENVTGASGTIAETQVARATADGHTVL